MALDDKYLPEATNTPLPKAFQNIGTGAPAPAAAPSLPPAFRNIAPPQVEDVGPETGLIPSVKRGAAQTFGMLANLVGAESVAAESFDYASQFPRAVENIQDVNTVSELGTFALEAGAENVANLLAIVGIGILTAYSGGTFAAGAFGANLALQAGEAKMAVQAEGGDVNIASVGVPALLNASIDTLSFLKIAKGAGVLNKVTKTMDEAAEVSGLGGRLMKGAKEGAKAIPLEGGTEVIQNYNNMWASKLAADKDVREAFALQGEDIDELINAFAAGGLGAAVTAGPMATVFAKSAKDNKTAKQGEAAPVQPTETKTDGTKTQAEPLKPVEESAPVSETPPETQAAGRPDEPSVVPDWEATIENLNAQIDAARAELEAGTETTFDPGSSKAGYAQGVFLFKKHQIQEPLRGRIYQKQIDSVYKDREGNDLAGTAIYNGNMKNTFMSVDTLSTNLDETTINEVQRLTETLRAQFLPDASIVIGDTQAFIPGQPGMGVSSYQEANDGSPVVFIGINPAEIRQNKEYFMNALVETVSHEVGHAVAQRQFLTETAPIQQAIYSEYQQWLKKINEMDAYEFFKNRLTPANFSVIGPQLKGMKLKDAVAPEYARYYLSFSEYFADSFARVAIGDKSIKKELSPESRRFWARVYETIKELYEKFKSEFKAMPKFETWVKQVRDNNIRELLYTIPVESKGIPQEVLDILPPEYLKIKDNLQTLDIVDRIFNTGKYAGLTDEQVNSMKNVYRKSTGFTRAFAGRFLTPSQIAERYGVPQAKEYMEKVYAFYTTKMQGISAADAVAKKWMDMPQAKADDFGRFVFDVSETSDRKRRKLTSEEISDLFEKHNIDQEGRELFYEMNGTFDEVLNRLYDAIVNDTVRTYINDEQKRADFMNLYERGDPVSRALALAMAEDKAGRLSEELGRVDKSFTKLRNRNYFPRMRFGDYTITVKEKQYDSTGKSRMVVTEFMTFESQKERDKVMAEMSADSAKKVKDGDVILTASKLDDTTRSLYGMPQLVVDRIERSLVASDQGMSPAQRAILNDISLDLSPGKRFLRHMQKRKNTPGFSTEAMRTYAAYMGNASNHLARVEHTAEMVKSLRDLRELQMNVSGDVTDLAELDSYYTDHFKYLLNPENDWAGLRAFGFVWYLGFNPKSALVNLTQLPMVTYPFLASRYGDVKTTGALAKAMKDITRHYRNRDGLPEGEQRLLDKLMAEGIIDESMASDLAGLSEGTALSRIMPENRAHRVINGINHYAAAFFRPAEKYNRMVTALATYRLNMAETGNFDRAYAASKEAVHKSQFEYAKYNRPEFMRGKKSAFFLFYNYTQQFMYLAFSGARTAEARGTAMRMWAMLFLLAGLQGLPFAEYVLSTLDLFGTKFKQWTGMENPQVNLRADLRELFGDLGVNPDLMMHGTGRYLGSGPLKLLEMFGVPVPNLDITGSLSMGEPLPGLRTNDLRGNPEEMAGQLLLNGLGPIPNIAIGLFNSMTSKDPDSWKNFEKALPVAFKNISKASRFYVRGEETTRGGAQFLLYDGSDPYHVPEIIAQAMGFTSTRLAQKRELYGEQMAVSMYWTQRRQLLMERYAYAVKINDARMKRETLLDIREFNKNLTKKALLPYRISRANLQRSLKSKLRVLSKRERGLPTSDRDRLVYTELSEHY